jgi:biopolymer transport protein ExbB/TolQ
VAIAVTTRPNLLGSPDPRHAPLFYLTGANIGHQNAFEGAKKMRHAKPLQILVAAGVMLALAHALMLQYTKPGDHFYAFIYQRGPVQHVTLAVACIVIAMLSYRFSHHRRSQVQFKTFHEGKGQPPAELARQLEVVGKTCAEHGVKAGAGRMTQVAEEYETTVQQGHEVIGFVASALPALGLFGTLLGLSDALFAGFGSNAGTSESVRVFVAGLATAMDTTVLGIACAVPLFGCAWLLSRNERALGEEYATHVRNRFRLDEVVQGDDSVHAMQTELRRLTVKIGAEAKQIFEQMIKDSAEAYRDNLERAFQDVFMLQRRNDKEMVKQIAAELAASLGQSVHRVGDLVEHHNGRLAENMIQHVGQLEKVLRNRIPEEVIVRYQHNGHANKD